MKPSGTVILIGSTKCHLTLLDVFGFRNQEDGDSRTYKQMDLAVNEEYDVTVTVVVDLSQLWCQIEIEKLEDLKCRLNGK